MNLSAFRGSLNVLLVTLSPVALANVTVSGNTLTWPADGWYQVQSTSDFTTVCQGGTSCEVAAGNYHVINHSTGERWEDLQVAGGFASTGLAPIVDGNTITWQETGWHQVQDRSDFSTVCQGGTSCTVTPGTYIVINHSNGQRWNNVSVTGSTGGTPPTTPNPVGPAPVTTITVTGNVITWPDDGWYQVQNQDTYQTECNGTDSCTVDDGVYVVINHTTGEREEDIVVGTLVSPPPPPTAAAPTVSGSVITAYGSGWIQFQSVADYSTVCQGVNVCTVDAGTYNVINHTTGERWENIVVNGGSPVSPPGLPPVTTPTTPPPTSTPPTGSAGDIYVVNPADPFGYQYEVATAAAPANGSPSVPQNLRVDLIGNDWVEFNWSPSADDGEVVAYNIYRDDYNQPLYVLEADTSHPNGGVAAELNKFWTTTSFIDCNRTRFLDRVYFCNGGPNGEPARGPEIGSAHSYRVSAVDDDGNESGLSDELAVQLYDQSGSPLGAYTDPHRADNSGFPVDGNLGSPSNFIGEFDLILDEDFNGAELDPDLWNTRLTWGPDVTINGENQYFVDIMNEPNFGYDPFEFNGSTLTIRATPTPASLLDDANDQRYLSGALSSYDKFGFTYGYVESRIRVSGTYGMLSTFYLYHRYAGEHGPEIDIVEYLGYNQYGDEDMFQTYHYRDSNYDANGITHSSPTMSHMNESGALYSESFHTYGMLWEPGLLIWYIDGVEVKRLHGPQVSRQRMNLVSYLVTGSAWTQAPDEYSPADIAIEMQTDDIVNPFLLEADGYPLDMEIDYIRVYQRPEHME